jgi:uncharacterized protein (DUF2141 family)
MGSRITVFLIIFILLISVKMLAQDTNNVGSVSVKITNLISNRGEVNIALFDSDKGFPDDYKNALILKKVKIINKQVEITFNNLNYGIYAVCMFHDENLNKVFDSNWFHIPEEGGGVSNDAKSSFGPPSFHNASFELKSRKLKISFKTNY